VQVDEAGANKFKKFFFIDCSFCYKPKGYFRVVALKMDTNVTNLPAGGKGITMDTKVGRNKTVCLFFIFHYIFSL